MKKCEKEVRERETQCNNEIAQEGDTHTQTQRKREKERESMTER